MNRIRDLRKMAGLNQTELAQRIGVVQSTLSYWEQGKYDIDNESLAKMADFFGCTIDYILGRTEDSYHVTESLDKGKTQGSELKPEPIRLEGVYLRMAKDAQDKQMSEAFIKKMFDLYEEFRELNKDDKT